jgi:hypothetical protein
LPITWGKRHWRGQKLSQPNQLFQGCSESCGMNPSN